MGPIIRDTKGLEAVSRTEGGASNAPTSAQELRSRISQIFTKSALATAGKASDVGLSIFRRATNASSYAEITSSGIDVKSGVAAATFTVLFYLAANALLSAWVAYHFDYHRPAFLDGTGRAQITFAARKHGWASETDGEVIFPNLSDDDLQTMPLHKIIEVQFLEPGNEELRDDADAAFRELVIGSTSDGFVLRNARVPSASEILHSLQANEATSSQWEAKMQNVKREKVLSLMIEQLLASLKLPLRLQVGLNGVIQFLTFIVAFFVLIGVTRRGLVVRRLAKKWSKENLVKSVNETAMSGASLEIRMIVRRLLKTSDSQIETISQDEFDRLVREINTEVYETYWFLAGMMPSLGFIGTVVGMSSSLMLADQLFGDSAKTQSAIGNMTQQLGLAFDTTFIALALGLITSIPIALLHSRERTLFRDLGASVVDLRHRIARQESAHAKSQ